MTKQPDMKSLGRCDHCGALYFAHQDVYHVSRTDDVVHRECWPNYAKRQLGADIGYFLAEYPKFITKGKIHAFRRN